MSKLDQLKPHDYDGIQEYDNQLPRWWVWTFVLTVVFGVGYWLYFQVYHKGPDSITEYKTKLALVGQNAQKSGSGDEVTNEMLLALAKDSAESTKASPVFAANCSACHGGQAQGIIGPNLTDAYWIHGGKPVDIYNTITNGVPEKGMLTWKGILTPDQIKHLTAYIISLQGSNPAGGKGPQGDLAE